MNEEQVTGRCEIPNGSYVVPGRANRAGSPKCNVNRPARSAALSVVPREMQP